MLFSTVNLNVRRALPSPHPPSLLSRALPSKAALDGPAPAGLAEACPGMTGRCPPPPLKGAARGGTQGRSPSAAALLKWIQALKLQVVYNYPPFSSSLLQSWTPELGVSPAAFHVWELSHFLSRFCPLAVPTPFVVMGGQNQRVSTLPDLAHQL